MQTNYSMIFMKSKLYKKTLYFNLFVCFIFLVSVIFHCSIVEDNSASGSNETADALNQIVAVNSLNKTPNCGTVKGRVGKDGKFSSTLLANSASDVIQVDMKDLDEITIRGTPKNWDISLERINPANCEILSTENSLGNSGIEEIKIVPIAEIQNVIRIKSGDQSGSGDYTLEAL